MQTRQRHTGLSALFQLHRIRCAEPEDRERNLLLQTKVTEILTRHNRWNFDNVLISERLTKRPHETLYQLRLVISRGSAFSNLHDRSMIVRNAGGGCNTLEDSLDRRQHVLSHFFLVSTNSQLQIYFIRDDVVASA